MTLGRRRRRGNNIIPTLGQVSCLLCQGELKTRLGLNALKFCILKSTWSMFSKINAILHRPLDYCFWSKRCKRYGRLHNLNTKPRRYIILLVIFRRTRISEAGQKAIHIANHCKNKYDLLIWSNTQQCLHGLLLFWCGGIDSSQYTRQVGVYVQGLTILWQKLYML